MSQPGTPGHPLRVAIVGAGPAGFYAAGHLLKQDDLDVRVDMFDRLPTPYGLVRGGVAPDHQKIKNVTRIYSKTALHHGFRFYGNIEIGNHLSRDDLRRHYHAVIYCTGAQSDRALDIPGETLPGSCSATDFVAWYNGHPDFTTCSFDLSVEHVAIVGVGNVAVDVARILCRTPEELERTDIADYALDALRQSRVREVTMLGRRGPAQAAFTPPEVKELGELADAVAYVPPDEAELDPLSRARLKASPDKETERLVEIIQSYARPPTRTAGRRLTIRFLVSPVEILGDATTGVTGMKLVKNELYETEDGRLRPRATDRYEQLDAGLVFRSVGYRGVAIPGVPFNAAWGIIPNAGGRVLDPETNRPIPGEYAAGWIKRGPTGVIGTNKSDAVETVTALLDDLQAGTLPVPATSDQPVERLIAERQAHSVTFEDWLHLDDLETARGKECGRPRIKFTDIEEMIHVLKERQRVS